MQNHSSSSSSSSSSKSKSKERIDWSQILLLLLHQNPPKTLLRFKQIHALFLTSGLSLHSLPFSRLLILSSNLSYLNYSYSSSLLLHSPLHPSPFLSNTLTSSLSSSGHHLLSLSLFPLLPNPPNSHSFPSLLKSSSSSPPLFSSGLSIHAHLLKTLPFPLDRFVLTSLLILHSRRRRPLQCRLLFDQIHSPDLPAWNALLSSSSSSSSHPNHVLSLFQRLQLSGARPNKITLLYLIRACGAAGALSQGMWAHAYLARKGGGVAPNCFLGAALIGMYSKCGRLDFARRVFVELPERDVFCCNAMMRGFAAHGDGRGALALLEEVGRRWRGVRPDDVTFVLVMSACAHAGLVDEGRRCFERMEGEFGMVPKVEHYGCLVDVLGRAGRIEEAEKVVREMPVEPNAMMFRALLGACRIHGRWQQVDEKVVRKLVELEPDHGGNFVLLSNIYAEFGRWDGAVLWRKEMRERGVEKSPGLSVVEIDGVVEEFAIGDQRHPRMKEIYEMLEQISRRLLHE